MSDPDYVVDTVEKARGLSLIKWDKCETLTSQLFDELDRNCGFCYLGRHRLNENERIGEGCELCGVDERCREIQIEVSDIETRLRELISKTLMFLKAMDVSE